MRQRLACLLFLVGAAPAVAQEAAPAANPPRVHVIGASVSGGFCDGPLTGATEIGESVTLQHVLKAWCGDHARATTHNTVDMTKMFLDPLAIGEAQIALAKKRQPEVVVAIDFLFWFGYGPMPRGDEDRMRKDRVRTGLRLLASLERPVLVGDFPDMRGALPRVMRPSWVPSPKTLADLNAQLAAFTAEQPNLHVVPLAELVATLREKGVVLPLAGGPLRTPPGALLQGDKLHANRLGMAFLGLQLQAPLRARFGMEHPLHAQQWTIEQFIAACGAEADVEQIQAAAKEQPSASGKGG